MLAPTPPAPRVELRAVPREPEPPAHVHAEPEPRPTLAMPMIELPEVGAAPFADMIETTPMQPAPSPLPQASADNPAVAVDEITIGDVAPDYFAIDDEAIGEVEVTGPARNEVAIGDVTLSSVLFGILVEEAVQHLATLTHELEVLQFDTRQLPSASMVRARYCPKRAYRK